MSLEKPAKRKYNSSQRKEQARQTRRQIIEAARRLFVARGYSRTSVESIAQEAGVAVETVYARFGNKHSILSALISFSLLGDDDPTPLLQREGPLAVVQEKDQLRQIELFSADMTGIMGRIAPLFSVMRAAAMTEPVIDEMLHKILIERAEKMKFFVSALLTNGPLREGLTQEGAAEAVWALTSAEVYTLTVTDLGWSVEKYRVWLADMLTRILIPV